LPLVFTWDRRLLETTEKVIRDVRKEGVSLKELRSVVIAQFNNGNDVAFSTDDEDYLTVLPI